jgi:hypothetical protein
MPVLPSADCEIFTAAPRNLVSCHRNSVSDTTRESAQADFSHSLQDFRALSVNLEFIAGKGYSWLPCTWGNEYALDYLVGDKSAT